VIVFTPYVLTLLIVEGILLLLAALALPFSLRIGLEFNPKATTAFQYDLNKKSYLVATIIMFILLLKLPLFFFFIWTMDALALSVSGAMCAAGILSASPWGSWMFFVKIIALFLLCAWVLVHRQDLSEPTYPFTKQKFYSFQGLFFLLVVEYFLQVAHFAAIPTDTPVHCCSVLFGQKEGFSTLFWQEDGVILGLFYGLYLLMGVAYFLKHPRLYGFTSLVWLGVSIYALIRFFSPYVYELPTHRCPFCLLQGEYYHVGYLMYALAFLGALGGVFVVFKLFMKRLISPFWYNLSFTCNTLLLLLLSTYPLGYYVRNGVWL